MTSHTIIMQIAKLRDVQHVTSMLVTHHLQDAFVLSHYVFSERKQTLVPVLDENHGISRPLARFLMLREGGVYFQGTSEELADTHDPYLLNYLA